METAGEVVQGLGAWGHGIETQFPGLVQGIGRHLALPLSEAASIRRFGGQVWHDLSQAPKGTLWLLLEDLREEERYLPAAP